MKKKSILKIGVLLIVVCLFVTGCKKTPLTAKEFKKKMIDKGYAVEDMTSQFKDYGYAKTVYVALDKKDLEYKIEYYELVDEKNAKNFYKTNKEKFDSGLTGLSSTIEKEGSNYNKFIQNYKGRYQIVSRIDTTAVYVDVKAKYKDRIDKELKGLGY